MRTTSQKIKEGGPAAEEKLHQTTPTTAEATRRSPVSTLREIGMTAIEDTIVIEDTTVTTATTMTGAEETNIARETVTTTTIEGGIDLAPEEMMTGGGEDLAQQLYKVQL